MISQTTNNPDFLCNLPQTLKGQKFVWKMPNFDPNAVLGISKKFNICIPAATVLVSRGYKNETEVSKFLFSSAERDVADPAILKDAIKTVERIELAIERKEKILIFGDYDVDGMTSTSIVLLALLPLGAKINYFLPDREKDGYGISEIAVTKAVAAGYSLIITVDNGTTAHQAAIQAKKLGIDLIITDHHQPKDDLPSVFALVNPHQTGCPYPNKNFCGAGVAFKLMDLLYKKRNLTLPEKVYELLMMGTIADMVPLDAENRHWVRKGLSALKNKMSYSFLCMAKNAGLDAEKSFWSAQDIGFLIAPQLNALGRIDNSREAVKFLVSSEKSLIETVAQRLKEINEERKKIDRSILQEIELLIKNGGIDILGGKIIMAADLNWPAGVIGLVAGKLLANYARPTLLFNLTKDGIAKGSCRSIVKFNIFKALERVRDLLIAFGGHACAAGLSLPSKNLPELKERLEEMVALEVNPEDLVPTLQIDADLSLVDAGKTLLDNIKMFEPFGYSNSVPIFLVREASLVRQPELLKNQHVKILIFSQGILKPVIFFNRPELYSLFLKNEAAPFDLVVNVNGNEWQGRVSVDFIGLDVRFNPENEGLP